MSALARSSADMGIPSIERRLGCLKTSRGRCINLLATWDSDVIRCGDVITEYKRYFGFHVVLGIHLFGDVAALDGRSLLHFGNNSVVTYRVVSDVTYRVVSE